MASTDAVIAQVVLYDHTPFESPGGEPLLSNMMPQIPYLVYLTMPHAPRCSQRGGTHHMVRLRSP